ncbi:chromosome segregation protein Csm1/Pcs1-domain-containing protein [Exophiala viscosa]|uniref:chromosome segregation protein Csm1/Pcs1-domain-containing protein n=1 Tax=Exophiala viscosa TaxID=2486360 RepID=UPI00219E0FE6|nr:chromosome segregation protein Csm1/Pcs1-domain-containing protein [Exophiala viscosa]
MKGIADLLDSDMEETTNFIDENSILSSASDATAPKVAQAKKGKKRTKVTMPAKSKPKVQKPASSQSKPPSSKFTAGAKRTAPDSHDDPSNANNNNHDAQRSEVNDAPAETRPKKRARTTGKAKVSKKTPVTQESAPVNDDVPVAPVTSSAHGEQSTNEENMEHRMSKKGAGVSKAIVSREAEQPRTESHEDTAIDNEETSEIALHAPVTKPKAAARNPSRVRQGYRHRAGSASDAERGDPNLRRKLGDITRKFENVDLKYRNLKEVGIYEANANMHKLRKQCDVTMQASNDLIASLRKELATQIPVAQEARKLKKHVQTQEVEMIRMRDTTTELEKSLAIAQNEIKALQAKLAAARAPSVEAVASKQPASAVKSNTLRQAMIGSSEAAQAAQYAQMKEELYSDLTGLIIRSVKRTEEGDTYDCIQTGRNGTLHFKLFVDHEEMRNTSFEETEFLYTPLLDSNRDRDMIALMPSYLTEDITFARQNAAKFYGRVVDTLTKRRAEE